MNIFTYFFRQDDAFSKRIICLLLADRRNSISNSSSSEVVQAQVDQRGHPRGHGLLLLRDHLLPHFSGLGGGRRLHVYVKQMFA